MERPGWPEWWHWKLHLSSHAALRTRTRDFTETDLRAMLEDASELTPDIEPGRWVVRTKLHGSAWEVIVEPDFATRQLVIVTGFAIQ